MPIHSVQGIRSAQPTTQLYDDDDDGSTFSTTPSIIQRARSNLIISFHSLVGDDKVKVRENVAIGLGGRASMMTGLRILERLYPYSPYFRRQIDGALVGDR